MLEKTEFLNVRVNPEWMEAVDKRVQELNMRTRSDYVRSLLMKNMGWPAEAKPKKSEVKMK